MEEYIIYVNNIEDLQATHDVQELERLFYKARVNLVGGGSVVLMRAMRSGETYRFDELTTLEALEEYKQRVFKYL